MAEGKTNMFGKTYNTIGSTDSNFIIKTKGDLKIQWGNRYIDLIKNGKIVSENSSVFQEASSQEEISSDGIYLITDENGDTQVWLCSGGVKVQLSSQSQETTFVSFMVEQEVTSDQQKQALSNIGFYYNSLQELQATKATAGIFYVLGEQKLYIAKDGLISEYFNTAVSNSQDDKQPLYIQDYSLWYNGSEYISCNNKVFILKQLELHNGLQSKDATDLKGYRLYIDEKGRSILDIDIVNERNYTLDEVVYIYSEHTNYILSSKKVISQEDASQQITLYTLKFPNKFKSGDSVFILQENQLLENYDVDTKQLTLTILEPISTDLYITLIQSETNTKLVLPKDTKELVVENVEQSYNLDYFLSSFLKEYKVIQSSEQTIQLDTEDSILGYIYKSNAPIIKIEDNIFEVFDRSVLINGTEADETIHTKIGPIKENELSSLTSYPTNEEEIEALNEYEKNIQVGIYSDNFIGLNSKLYNPIFKKRCDGQYPRYDELLTIPEEDQSNEKYDQVVPNIGWIKQLLDTIIPVGTIVMWSGSEIPKGWAICDGNNGTPNLIGKFIKASETAGETGGGGNHTIEGNNNYIKLTTEHLPDHTHGIGELTTSENGSHTHSYNDEYTDWKTSGTGDYDTTNITTTGDTTFESLGLSSTSYKVSEDDQDKTSGSSGAHSHTISATNTSGVNNVTNDAFSIEPSYFSLVFIMKVPTNTQ